MRPYEVMVIFEATTEPTVIQGVVDRALEVIRTTGGNPGAIDRWGRRTFAYEVNHKREGYYVVVEFTVEHPDRGRPRPHARAWPTRSSATRSSGCPSPAACRAGRRRRPAEPSGERSTPCRSDNSVILVGNVTRDPELRFTNTGQPTASFGLAVNRRWQNRQTQEWEEATSFFDVVCWREMAENVSETLTRGARVMVAGRLEQRSWETQDGDKRSKVEVVADEIGPSLRWATAQITKNERRGPSDGPPRRWQPAAGRRRRTSSRRQRRRLRIR